MRYYELTINTKKIPHQNFSEEQTDSLLEKVASYLPNPPVRQQKTTSFLSLEFYSDAAKIPELEKKLKADSLRYMLLVKELPSKISEKETKRPRRRTITAKSVAKPKVELKKIDEKLEEILKET